MSILIRPATRADLLKIDAMFHEFSDYLHAIADPEIVTENAMERIAELAFGSEPLCRILIAEHGSEVAGYLTYAIMANMEELAPALHVLDFFVRAAHRRRGIGRALMQEARCIAEAANATRLFWQVWRRNPEAIRFYEKLGAELERENLSMLWKIR
ncbi:MAG: GNAT family N-acetyltransferase [Hyphomicrobiaceae bacterium]